MIVDTKKMGNCLYYLQLPFTKSGENLRGCPIFKDISYVVWAMLSDWNFNGRIIPSSHNCWLREFSWNGEGSIKFLPQCNILVVEIFGAKSFLQFYEYACLNVCFKLSERNYMQLCIFANIFLQFRVLQITMQFCASFAKYYMFGQLYPIRFPNASKS